MNKFSITLLTLLVLVIVAGVGVVLFYDQPSEQPKVVEQPSETGNQLIENDIDTSDWQTYRNEELGISFRYPGTWELGSGIYGGGFLGDVGIYPPETKVYAPTGEEIPIITISFDHHNSKGFMDKVMNTESDGKWFLLSYLEDESGVLGQQYSYGFKNENGYIERSVSVNAVKIYNNDYELEKITKTILESTEFLSD